MLQRLSGVPVPAPEQKACGAAFELSVAGHFQGKVFVVESFEKLPVLEKLHLSARSGGCTKMKCTPSHPCCNRCQYSWVYIDQAGAETQLKMSGVAVPDPEQKDCGVASELDITGHFVGETFVVKSFKKTAPRTAKTT